MKRFLLVFSLFVFIAGSMIGGDGFVLDKNRGVSCGSPFFGGMPTHSDWEVQAVCGPIRAEGNMIATVLVVLALGMFVAALAMPRSNSVNQRGYAGPPLAAELPRYQPPAPKIPQTKAQRYESSLDERSKKWWDPRPDWKSRD